MLAALAILTAATAIAGQPTTVTCHAGPDFIHVATTLGHTRATAQQAAAFGAVNHPRIWLRNGHCRTLQRVANGELHGFWARQKVALSVLILGHEVAHNHGITSEHDADCWGAAQSKRLARQLGHPQPYRVRDWATWLTGCDNRSSH